MRERSRGITAVELMVTFVIVAIGVSLAGPSFQNFITAQRAQSAMNTMYSDLRLAQSEAIKRQVTVYFSLNTSSTPWCYGLNDSTSCNCNTANNCQLNGVTKVVTGTSFPNVTVGSTLTSNNVAFESNNGTVNATGTVTLTDGSNSNTITINDEGTLMAQ